MSKKPRPNLLANLTDMSAKQEASMATKRPVEVELKSNVEEEIPGAPPPAKSAADKTLPKVTLYAHPKVLRAIRLVAVEDDVQAQVILRRAVRDYLATRGHSFTDLTTGQ